MKNLVLVIVCLFALGCNEDSQQSSGFLGGDTTSKAEAVAGDQVVTITQTEIDGAAALSPDKQPSSDVQTKGCKEIVTPEPQTYLLFALGLLAIFMFSDWSYKYRD